MLTATTRVSRRLKGLLQPDVGLAAASVAALTAGFALTFAGPLATGSNYEPIAEPQANLASGFASDFASDLASVLDQTEPAFEPGADGGSCATFAGRFASAFGSSGNATTALAAVEEREQDNDRGLPQLDFSKRANDGPAVPATLLPMPLRRPSLREERANAAVASLNMSLPLDADGHTAIYDISARTVYLPNGQKLEAHSGLGSRLDDPRFIRTKMQGPTPPNVYNLTLREQLFHGVRAIRLNPVDDGKMFGRDGILAHTYMLGPNGQSNGCVSFRNYPAFLNAFLKGEIKRLVVVERLATTTAKASGASGG